MGGCVVPGVQVRTYGFGGGARMGVMHDQRVVLSRYYHWKASDTGGEDTGAGTHTGTGPGTGGHTDNTLGSRLDSAHDWKLENEVHNRLEQAGMV